MKNGFASISDFKASKYYEEGSPFTLIVVAFDKFFYHNSLEIRNVFVSLPPAYMYKHTYAHTHD